ncbi:MAG: type II secretion system F family protein [Planctomycetaceae bacterium]|nr:type II secretion system F family protein [Planctomycetaceae bacterium]
MRAQVLTPARIKPRPEFAAILKETEPYGHGESDDLGNRLNSWFDALMLQSGVNISPPLMLALCVCSALAVGGAAFVLQEDLLATSFGALIGFAAPIAVFVVLRSRRQKQMTEQLPPAIDELSRAARTGRSLESCLRIIAADTPAPLGVELRWAARKLDMGLSVSQAIRDLPLRTGLISMRVLTTALSVHEQTGGDLVQVLDRLSRTLRERAQFLGRLNAMTAAFKGTAVFMLILPVGIIGFYMARDPNYVSDLIDSRWGLRTLIVAVVLQIIGSSVIVRILSRSQRG